MGRSALCRPALSYRAIKRGVSKGGNQPLPTQAWIVYRPRMKSLLLAMLVGLMMVGCGEEAQKEASFAIKPGENFTITDLNLTMIWVEPGIFTMGSPTSEAGRQFDREDEHNVTLTKGFYLGKYEVTQAQWKRVMGSDPSNFKGAGRPVEEVSWNDAVEFCKKLTDMEKKAGRVPKGMAYQLPTEAQWEYACRAGTSTAYSWGDTIAKTNANYAFDGYGKGLRETTPVGSYPANPWGLHDMHGNAWEWCADWYGSYPSGSVTDPEGPAAGSYRVLRGGSWLTDGTFLRSALRDVTPSVRDFSLGFRVGFLPSK